MICQNSPNYGDQCNCLFPPGDSGNSGGPVSLWRRVDAPKNPVVMISESPLDVHEDPSPETLIAKELARLSLGERQTVEDDIHGVSEIHKFLESPETMNPLLEQLDSRLQQLKPKTAYELAESMSTEYVLNRNFRSKFLRAERYKPVEAAERMIRFFEVKKSLFGTKKLVKDITLSDLSEDDMVSLKSGGEQLGMLKDMIDRSVLLTFPNLRKYKTPQNQMRAAYYVYMAAVECCTEQRKGCVTVTYMIDATKSYQSLLTSLRSSLPVRFMAHHICVNNTFGYTIWGLATHNMPHTSRLRSRVHVGSHVETHYALTTFGIPRSCLPISADGEVHNRYHLSWIERRRQLEQSRADAATGKPGLPLQPNRDSTPNGEFTGASDYSRSASPQDSARSKSPCVTVEPNPHDVLLGRGRSVAYHPGNAQLSHIVHTMEQEYEAASRTEKTTIAYRIVEMIRKSSGRFMKQSVDGGSWVEVNDTTARRKVAHAFRNRRSTHGASSGICQ